MAAATEALAAAPQTDGLRVVSPFPVHALPRVWVWAQQFPRAVLDDFSPKSLDEFIAGWREGPRTWGVLRDGELGGIVTFEPVNPVVGESHCMFARRFWGNETTLPALRAVYEEVFAEGFEKILGRPFAHNSPMIALAKRIGFEREGTLRGHTRQDGKPVDLAILGLTREGFEKCLS